MRKKEKGKPHKNNGARINKIPNGPVVAKVVNTFEDKDEAHGEAKKLQSGNAVVDTTSIIVNPQKESFGTKIKKNLTVAAIGAVIGFFVSFAFNIKTCNQAAQTLKIAEEGAKASLSIENLKLKRFEPEQLIEMGVEIKSFGELPVKILAFKSDFYLIGAAVADTLPPAFEKVDKAMGIETVHLATLSKESGFKTEMRSIDPLPLAGWGLTNSGTLTLFFMGYIVFEEPLTKRKMKYYFKTRVDPPEKKWNFVADATVPYGTIPEL